MVSVLLFVGWLLIPLVLLTIWSVTSRPISEGSQARVALATLIVAAAIASAAYRALRTTQLDQSAGLFIGIPVTLALAAVFSPTPRSAIGAACKAVTIGMLISTVFLWEGLLCIVMSAPIFYGVAIIVGVIVGKMRDKSASVTTRAFSMVALIALMPMSLEGVSPATSLNRNVTVSETRMVNAAAGDVERALFSQPRFDRTLPRYLRAGFPRPIHVAVGQPAVGSQWTIRFRGGETHLNGQEPADGDLILEIDELSAGRVSWHAVSDTSHVTHFLQWRGARVEWQPVDATHTRVTWTSNYRRGLDPAWYFGPMERYAMQLATGYLIDSVATP